MDFSKLKKQSGSNLDKLAKFKKDNPEYTKETIEPLVAEYLKNTNLRMNDVAVSEISN